MSEERIDSLRRAVAANPQEHTLRLMLAEELHSTERDHEALAEYEILVECGGLDAETLVSVGNLAARNERLDLARGCLEAARQAGVVEGVAELQSTVDEMLAARGAVRVRADGRGGLGEPVPDIGSESTTFERVGGMDDVKRVLHRMIILPLSRPELYETYGRKAGGGVMLYGPPGCGKTLLARAVAGECGLPFVNLRIEDVIDPYLGVAERNLHGAFEAARAQSPCVLFLDELDALAFARHKQYGSETRRLVDVLLQELDAIGSDNSGVLVLAATNAPWDVDEATLRPGRFDRVIFVPPPDETARGEIVRTLLSKVPVEGVDPAEVAGWTPLFSGADLNGSIDRAVDQVIEEALSSDGEPPLRSTHLRRAIDKIRPSTLEWLERARAYVEFANQTERYSDVAEYLNSRDVRRRMTRYRS